MASSQFQDVEEWERGEYESAYIEACEINARRKTVEDFWAVSTPGLRPYNIIEVYDIRRAWKEWSRTDLTKNSYGHPTPLVLWEQVISTRAHHIVFFERIPAVERDVRFV